MPKLASGVLDPQMLGPAVQFAALFAIWPAYFVHCHDYASSDMMNPSIFYKENEVRH